MTGPARNPFRGWLVQQLQNSLVGRLRIDRLLARPRLVLQAFQAMVGVAMPPKADDPGLDPNFLGDRPRAASGRRQKNYPRPLQIALQRHRRATARLKHLAIFPRKVDFSRFGYHPYLESRLTIQEKWVLDRRISPNRYRPPIRCLAQCTAALEPRPDAPTDAVGTHSCVGRTSDSIASAEPASPLAGQSGPARLGCQAFAPLPHPASGFPPVSPVSVRRSRSAIAPE